MPLLPELLTRRRSKLDYPLRASEELGIDRPAFIFGVGLIQAGDAGYTNDELYSVYATRRDTLSAAVAAAAGAGLVEERGGRWRQTAKGREYMTRLRAAAHAHFASLRTIAEDDLRRLADLLERAFQACAQAPEPPPDRILRAKRWRDDEHYPPPNPLAALENAVQGLWSFRDDCHIAAWRAERLDGPTLDVLTRIWREEGQTAAELAPKLTGQTAADVHAALGRLRVAGLVADGDPLHLTEPGRVLRRRIEDETDRLFFGPWPDDVGREAEFIRAKLAEVNAALA